MVGLKRNIFFNEELHRYTDEYNNVYTSVTTVITKYYPKFDTEKWAKHTADKTGLTVSAVKQNWKNITEIACENGTKEHKLLEDSINDSRFINKFDKPSFGSLLTKIGKTDIELLSKSPLALKYPDILFKLLEFINQGYTLYVEKRVYWADFLIAGTIDCLAVKDGRFWIIDWKTNKDELKFKSGYYKKVNGIKTNQWVDKKEYFFKPINDLENCKGNIYTLQLSLYAYLLELWGLKCEGLLLYHIRKVKDKNGIEELILKDYKIPYLKQSCQLLTIDHKNGLNNINTNNNSINLGLF